MFGLATNKLHLEITRVPATSIPPAFNIIRYLPRFATPPFTLVARTRRGKHGVFLEKFRRLRAPFGTVLGSNSNCT